MCRAPGYPGGDAARAAHRAFVEACLTGGQLRTMRSASGALSAYTLTLRSDPEAALPRSYLVVERTDGADTLAWVQATLAEDAPSWPDDLEVGIPSWDAPLRRALMARGLSIESVILAGRVERALSGLVAAYDPPRDLSHLGLSLAPVTPAHADAIVALRERVFTAEPQFCWFGARPGYLAGVRAALLSPTRPGHRLVVLRGEQVLGFLSCTFMDDDPHHAPAGGMDLILDASIRGQGVSKVGYRVLLEALRDHGAEWIKGTTGQQPVMKLARVMGREAYATLLSRRASFPPGWFDIALGE